MPASRNCIRRRIGLLVPLGLLLLVGGRGHAADQVDYLRDVKPILAKRCYACHGALQQQSDLRLDTAALAKQGGASGPAIVPGDAEESLLLGAVTGDAGFRMPPEEEGSPLTEHEVALIKTWIDGGASAPEESVPPDPREHWSYQPPVRPPVPSVKNADWVKRPIDAFIAAEHEKRGLVPAGPADRQVLLRRVYLDLVGLPPTREELEAFVADLAEDAYEKVVDRLLASPQYGERWGRHWMDVWRYSDWSGYNEEIRNSQPHIWRWRDWIIESLNQDKGYDQMVVEMLAGDELAPTDPNVLRATGYLVRNWYKFNRNTWLDATVEHTAKAFLGVTLNCARCHDHKYDPLRQQEYFQLRAIFEPHDVRTDRVPGEVDTSKDGLPRVVDTKAEEPTYLFIRGSEKRPDKEHPLAPGVPKVLGGQLDIQPVELPPEAYYPGLRPFVMADQLKHADQVVTAAAEAIDKAKTAAGAALAEKKLATAEATRTALVARVAAEKAKYGLEQAADVAELTRTAVRCQCRADVRLAEEQVLEAEQELAAAREPAKGEQTDEAKKKSAAAVAAAEKKLADTRKKLEGARDALAKSPATYKPLGEIYPATSTGRRLALARWITSRDNPLAARVAVNHIWLRHFGAPLVDNTFDFGLRSEQVRHRSLLDWLAVELIESGWSMKALHRLMVTSNTYRMKSTDAKSTGSNLAIDADNRFLWRMNSRRMEGELVRDSILHLTGNLDPTMGGPDIDHQAGQASRRRSVYFRHAYEKQMKFLELFDAASVNECYRRTESIVPQQALAMINSALSQAEARLLARRLAPLADASDEPQRAFIVRAFEEMLARPPLPAEIEACLRFLTEQAARLADPAKLTRFDSGEPSAVKPADDPQQRARESLVHVLWNHNDFVTIR